MQEEKKFTYELTRRVIKSAKDIEYLRNLALNLLTQNESLQEIVLHPWFAQPEDKDTQS